MNIAIETKNRDTNKIESDSEIQEYLETVINY